MGDRLAEPRHRLLLETQIAFDDLLHRFADKQPIQHQTRHASEKQEAFDQQVGVLHLIDQLVVLVGAEFCDSPMPEHAGMQKVLVDRRNLVFQHRIEVVDNYRVASHGRLLSALPLSDKHIPTEFVPFQVQHNGLEWRRELS